MSEVVVDIETVGFDFDSFDSKAQEYLLKYAQSDSEKEEVKKRMGLYPLTGEIVTIGMLNPKTDKGMVLFQAGKGKLDNFEEEGIRFEFGDEKAILEIFWQQVKKYQRVITFNGRGFDVPFLLMRSAKHKISPTKNLLGRRYNFLEHCDLLDQFTFYGLMRKFNLDFYAKYFGIKSSKEGGIDGSLVGELYRQGAYREIARYCLGDLRATAELYAYWDKYLKL